MFDNLPGGWRGWGMGALHSGTLDGPLPDLDEEDEEEEETDESLDDNLDDDMDGGDGEEEEEEEEEDEEASAQQIMSPRSRDVSPRSASPNRHTPPPQSTPPPARLIANQFALEQMPDIKVGQKRDQHEVRRPHRRMSQGRDTKPPDPTSPRTVHRPEPRRMGDSRKSLADSRKSLAESKKFSLGDSRKSLAESKKGGEAGRHATRVTAHRQQHSSPQPPAAQAQQQQQQPPGSPKRRHSDDAMKVDKMLRHIKAQQEQVELRASSGTPPADDEGASAPPDSPCADSPRGSSADKQGREREPSISSNSQQAEKAKAPRRKPRQQPRKETPRQPPLYWPTQQGADLCSIAAMHNGSCSAALQSLGPLEQQDSPLSKRDASAADGNYSSYAASGAALTGGRRGRGAQEGGGEPAHSPPRQSASFRAKRKSLASTLTLRRSTSQGKRSGHRSGSTPLDGRRGCSTPKSNCDGASPGSPGVGNASLGEMVAQAEVSHRVAPPPITRSRHETIVPRKQAARAARDMGKDARRVTIEVELTFATGQTSVMRYISCEGLMWAYAFWAGEKDPMSEVRGFHYSPDTRQLCDQNGVGGQIVGDDLFPALEAIVSFANLTNIPHNIHLTLPRRASPPPLRTSKRNTTLSLLPHDDSPLGTPKAAGLIGGAVTISHSPYANSWGLFKAWLSSDSPGDGSAASWGHVHGDVDVRGSCITLQGHPHDESHCAVAKQTLSHGTYNYYFQVKEGARGVTIGLCKKAPDLNADLSKLPDSYTYSSIGEVWRHGKELIAAESFAAGDRVGMHVDLIRGTLSWSRNGRGQHITFNRLIGAYKIVVSLREPGSSVEMQDEEEERGRSVSTEPVQRTEPVARSETSATIPQGGSPTRLASASPTSPYLQEASAVSLDNSPPEAEPETQEVDTSADASPRSERSISGRSKRGSVITRTMITSTLKSGAKMLVGPVDMYLPAGVLATMHRTDPPSSPTLGGVGTPTLPITLASPRSPLSEVEQSRSFMNTSRNTQVQDCIHLKLSRVKPDWGVAPDPEPGFEPSRSLSPRRVNLAYPA